MILSRLEYLFSRYFNNTCTKEEADELMVLIRQADNEQVVKDCIDRLYQGNSQEKEMNEVSAASILHAIQQAETGKTRATGKKRRMVYLFAAAGIVTFIAAAGLWLARISSRTPDTSGTSNRLEQLSGIPPGSNKAMLTLSDGKKYFLDSTFSGTLIQGGTQVEQLKNGQLSYRLIPGRPLPAVMNTVATPRGGLYQIILPDSSIVRLNAASSLRFPSAFTGKNRTVELTGEGYFIVARNSSLPFHVMVHSGAHHIAMDVEVVGTTFNISAYENELTTKTSVLNGRVKISGGSILLLAPGEQVQMDSKGALTLVQNPDITSAVAWMEGIYQYKSIDIQTFMRVAERWYNVEVIYEGPIPTDKFTGAIPLNVPLSQWLKVIQSSGINYTVKGNRIIISK